MIKEAIEKIIENSYGNDPEYFYKCNKTDNLTFADRRLIALNQELDIQCIYTQRTLAPEKFKHQIYVLYSGIVVGISLKNGNLSYSQMKKSNIEPFIESIIEIPTSLYDVSEKARNEEVRKILKLYVDSSPTEYKLNTITISEGYNLRELPTSCMKGQGLWFKPLDTMGKMYYLTSNKTTNILARCIVWDKGVVINSIDDEPIDCQIYDKVYQLEGKYGNIFKDMLEAKGILQLDGLETIDTWDLYINNPFVGIENDNYPWMDRFSLLDKRLNRLYYYHEDDYGNGWYYSWNNRDEPIAIENSDYVEFQDVDDTRYMIPKCDAVEDMIGELDTDYVPRDMAIEVKSLGPNYFIYNDYFVSVVKEHFENCLANGQGDAEEFAQIVRDLGGEWDYDQVN